MLPFRNLGAILFTLLCPCLSEETIKAVGPFYLVSMSGEVKVSTQGNGKTCELNTPERAVDLSTHYLPV